MAGKCKDGYERRLERQMGRTIIHKYDGGPGGVLSSK